MKLAITAVERSRISNDTLFEMPDRRSVWMYGGGRQSAAIAILIKEGKIPQPDFACIADTGREKQSTWDYLEQVVQPAMPFTIHRISKQKYATVDLFGLNGDISKLPTFCSNEWKTRVCERWLKKEMRVGGWQAWIGFSFNEVKRWKRMRDAQGDMVRFPLVDDFELTADGCVKLVQDYGWPKPPQSSCFICPNMRDNQWAELPADELEKAIILDEEIRLKDPHAFLHSSCQPLRQVKFTRIEEPQPCDTGGCFT